MEAFFDAAKNKDYGKAQLVAEEVRVPELRSLLMELAKMMAQRKPAPDFLLAQGNKGDRRTEFARHMVAGYHFSEGNIPDHLEAFKRFSEALKMAEDMNNAIFSKAALIGILNLFSREIFIGGKQYKPYLERFAALGTDAADKALLIMYQLVFLSKGDDDLDRVDAQYYAQFERLDSIFEKLPKTHPFFPSYYFEKGMFHKIEGDKERALGFFLRADSLSAQKDNNGPFRASVAWQLAAVHYEHDELPQAWRYLNLYRKGKSNNLWDAFYDTRLASLIFEKQGQYDSAYHYLQQSVETEYLLGYKRNTLETALLTVRNETDQLKLDKLRLQASTATNRKWAIFLGGMLLAVAMIAILAQKNAKRKQLVAEQGKVIEEQKVATLLKEQELSTIDAMIQGQEKERRRVANELHDDLGSLMAAVKMQFNALKEKKGERTGGSLEKTEELINEAYGKIRAIAHAKNSGLMAKKGLLQAVRQMAGKVSVAKDLHIHVMDHGLEARLENSMELTLFRMVQELITNVIKHAAATEVNIHITNHGDILNILVEDNGRGFDVGSTSMAKGMGLRSIDKRVAHLHGNMNIESGPENGTVVIIDIPL
ncbi:ATP-binding protein [Maribacter sp. 2307ULW6-5]